MVYKRSVQDIDNRIDGYRSGSRSSVAGIVSDRECYIESSSRRVGVSHHRPRTSCAVAEHPCPVDDGPVRIGAARAVEADEGADCCSRWTGYDCDRRSIVNCL